MTLVVKSIEGPENKGTQQEEKDMLKKQGEQTNQANDTVIPKIIIKNDNPDPPAPPAETKKAEEEVKPIELKEEEVLSYIGKRFNKQINSFDELMEEREKAEQMPEDVAAYMKYRKETGRGFDDFVKLGQDFDKMDPDSLLRNFYKETKHGLDEDDIEVLLSDFKTDEDDDEIDVKKVNIAKKMAIAEAKKYFIDQKEQYKKPLESSVASLSKEEKEEFDAYKQYTQKAKTVQEMNKRKGDWFVQKTEEVFNEFKGFEFKIDDVSLKFNPGDAAELKKAQLTPMNFINKYMDEDGLIKDAAGYHRALSVAMNPDKFAKFFFEQGKSAASLDVEKELKNIKMSERKAPEYTSTGMKVREVNPDSGRSLKIQSKKNN